MNEQGLKRRASPKFAHQEEEQSLSNNIQIAKILPLARQTNETNQTKHNSHKKEAREGKNLHDEVEFLFYLKKKQFQLFISM
jgi:hypothetical protein